MRVALFPNGDFHRFWLSSRDTYDWANKSGAAWPCSYFADKRLYAEFERNGDLVDVRVDGKYVEDIPADEFTAITSDFINNRR